MLSRGAGFFGRDRSIFVEDRLESRELFNGSICADIGIAVDDFSVWQRTGIEDAKSIAGEAEGAAFALEFATLQRHPAKMLAPPIAQVGAVRREKRSASFCLSLQKFQTKLTVLACRFSRPVNDFTR